MKTVLSLFLMCFPLFLLAQPCTTTNATGCGCPDGTSDCDLIPDITISWYALQNYDGGPTEYSQNGNGADDGRLRLTGSTPNIGWGPFTVRGVDQNGYRWFVCGTDTVNIYDPNATVEYNCANGEVAKQILFQRIYHKSGNTMSFTEHMTGTMTYHPTHGHNHVDDWAVFTLRVEDPNEPDTLKWPIIGTGAKIGFCLMDFGTCDYYIGHCRDHQAYGSGNVLTMGNFPNYGLGGGQYNCSPIEQGISVGHTDIYSEYLDGMWINIPPTSCNGNYWIVAEVDPHNNFIEMNDNNNWTAIPFTLNKQLPPGTATAEITIGGDPYLCNGSSVTLQSSPALFYSWSTGDTTSQITVSAQGDYFVETNSTCGQAVSDTVTVQSINSAITLTEQDTTCFSGSLNLAAQGTGEVNWYDAPAGGNLLFTGTNYTTPVLQSSSTYYVENVTQTPGTVSFSEPHDHTGTSLYSANQFNGYIIFDCFSSFTLKSVKVYTDFSATRLIELRNSSGVVLADTSVYIGAGITRITLNFQIAPGTDYQLGTNTAVNQANFGYAGASLRRSGSGVNYPYVIDGVLSLNDSPYGQTYYYYFYDWEVAGGSISCASPRTAVEAVVGQHTPLSITGLDSVYQVNDNAVTIDGQPAGGIFSGNGISGNVFSPQQAGLGNHAITYSYADSYGCADITSMNVRVKSGQINASAGQDTVICEGQSATLTAAGGTIFLWSTGETLASIVVNPANTTTYSVTVSDSFGNSDIADVTVTVNERPTVDFTGLDSVYLDTDNPATLTGTPAGGTFSGEGMQGDIFYPSSAGAGGPYEIIYFYSDGNGCSNIRKRHVIVDADNTGLPSTNFATAIKVYPNPTQDVVFIDFSHTSVSRAHVRLLNSVGATVMSQEALIIGKSSLQKLNLSRLAQGVYLLEITTQENTSVTRIIRK